jgi:hypothetical protein
VVPLPGTRLAWIAGASAHVVALDEEGPRAHPAAVELGLGEVVSAHASEAGRVLITGASGASAALWDPGRGAVLSRTPVDVDASLLVLGDGSLVEIGPRGSALRREDEPAALDDPPATILFASDDDWLTLDPTDREGASSARWETPAFVQRGSVLEAGVTGARADVRALEGGRLEVIVRGTEIDLVLRGAPVTIALEAGSISVGDCTLPRSDGDPVVIEPGSIGVAGGRCPAAIAGRVGVAVRARAAGAVLASISIVRVPAP